MGIFNLFGSKNEQADFGKEYNLRKLKCDAEKFDAVVRLVKTPKNERDEVWQDMLLQNIDTASFSESMPQVKIGSDGFPYFIFKTSEKFNPFEFYCIRKIKDDILLERGFGVVLNPGPGDEHDWLFSYGDILNYHLNGEFYTGSHDHRQPVSEEKDLKEAMISQPSENYLPLKTRRLIQKLLVKEGISKPRMLMLSRQSNDEMFHELMFNIFPEDFPDQEARKKLVQKVKWYLPRHYHIRTVSKKSDLIRHLKNL